MSEDGISRSRGSMNPFDDSQPRIQTRFMRIATPQVSPKTVEDEDIGEMPFLIR